ncbi:MAG: alkaline phosphatase family protein [Candidatus Binatus sp.]|uniref:alkaline phosphatase family protein n=1 Tax=Candidatus Binatus sp. TaxID=2811406 RepID=UPI002723351D|nr:alkaline phosphatase family protein [Candidatus Binatus sp.]MDO8431675.1 alkaline phosphatase family protein [Candidatus Binatus sp.]
MKFGGIIDSRRACAEKPPMKFIRRIAIVIVALAMFAPPASRAEDRLHPAANVHGRGRIVILMVLDGLRPDLVTQRDTPNLYRMMREGVRFDRHHSLFPTLTMVNGAALATGASPGVNGLAGNVVFLKPPAGVQGTTSPAIATDPAGRMVFVENTKTLIDLNEPTGFAGRLLGLDTGAQEVEREGGYLAIIGKQGPTILFDDRVHGVANGKDSLGQAHADYLFVSDDVVEPAAEAEKIQAAMPARSRAGVLDDQRDLYFTRLVVEKAIPAARRAAEAGRPALIVLWQHNPDVTQHAAGLGTLPAEEALNLADSNLLKIRTAIDSGGIADKTDLIVVSDHGFATVKYRLVLSELLVSAGVKRALDSPEITVAPNGGADLIYLSPSEFPTREQRRAILQKIVNFAEAQEWCGPIFSRDLAQPAADTPRKRRARNPARPFLGWIDGTFSQSIIGLYNSERSPDLVISFGELPDIDNRDYTGPAHPGFALGKSGQMSSPNRSKELIHPVKGLMYADVGDNDKFTTGMGMHGSAGEREIHNFCAATGPDFRRGYVDLNPTSNIDVAPTITRILGTLPNVGPGGVIPTGRVMTEALVDGQRSAGGAHTQTMTTSLELQGVKAVASIRVTWIGDEPYLDSSSVARVPLGSSP